MRKDYFIAAIGTVLQKKIVQSKLATMKTLSVLMKKMKWSHVRQLSGVSHPSFTSWDLMSSVCVERCPVITKKYTDLEKRFSNFVRYVDAENSLKSDHELRWEEDLLRSVQFKRGELDDSELDRVTTVQTAQDLEDSSNDELQQFKFGQRETDADNQNTKTSLQRALDKYLILVVNQMLGKDKHWILPQGQWQSEESLRQTGERVLKTLCGDHLKVKFLGNAPIAFYKYKYPLAVQEEKKSLGAKVFFFRAQYIDGEVLPGKNISDFAWLSSEEIKDVLKSSYCKVINNVLIENSNISF